MNPRLLSNQIARQWWGTLVSAATRDHLWLTNGLARYSELLYVEHTAGAGAFEAELRDTFVEALTVDNPPLIQTGRLEDYSPEFWALTAGKGAAVLNMLSSVIGDENFSKLLKEFPAKFAWKEVTTADFRRSAEELAGADLQYFFREWIESSGAPEFKLEYTVFRIGRRASGWWARSPRTWTPSACPSISGSKPTGTPRRSASKWWALPRSSPWRPSASPGSLPSTPTTVCCAWAMPPASRWPSAAASSSPSWAASPRRSRNIRRRSK